MTTRGYSGKYRPENPSKYAGDPNNIVYRSLWERKVMAYLDKNDSIVSWGSEEFFVPYVSPIDNKVHRYFPDMIIRVRTKDGKTKTFVWEIKPEKQTMEPVKKSKVTKRYVTEVLTYGVNQAKWKAAQEFCADRGWQFQLITEKNLGIGK